MDIHNSITDIHSSIMDIHNSVMDIHNYMLAIMDIHNWITDIHNYRVYAPLAFHMCGTSAQEGAVLTCHQSPSGHFMVTSSNGNIFRVTGPMCGEFTGHRWIPLTKATDAELRYFLWFTPEQTVE